MHTNFTSDLKGFTGTILCPKCNHHRFIIHINPAMTCSIRCARCDHENWLYPVTIWLSPVLFQTQVNMLTEMFANLPADVQRQIDDRQLAAYHALLAAFQDVLTNPIQPA